MDEYDAEYADHSKFFFFQAEDGIRDKLVTGVQTCALPISATIPPSRGAAGAASGRSGAVTAELSLQAITAPSDASATRQMALRYMVPPGWCAGTTLCLRRHGQPEAPPAMIRRPIHAATIGTLRLPGGAGRL